MSLLLAAPASAQLSFPVDGDGRQGGGGGSATTYAGGPRSLPLGPTPPHLVLEAALGLEPVRAALVAFERRGYLRRPDQDAAFTRDNYALAVIAYEKPGVSPEVRQPALFVITRPIGDCFATQVFGGVVGPTPDGEHVRTYDDEDAFVLVGWTAGGGGAQRGMLRPEAGGTSNGELAGFASAYDPVHWNPVTGDQFWNYAITEATGHSPGLWQEYGQTVGLAVVLGGLNGFRTMTWQGAAWGAVVGWAGAHYHFWGSHK